MRVWAIISFVPDMQGLAMACPSLVLFLAISLTMNQKAFTSSHGVQWTTTEFQGTLRLVPNSLNSDNITPDVQPRLHDYNVGSNMNFSIGSPPKNFSAQLDTGSELIWVNCGSSASLSDQVYDPNSSHTSSVLSCAHPLCRALGNSTCANNRCHYYRRYADNSSSSGIMEEDTFSFPGAADGTNIPINNIGFGCGTNQVGQDSRSAGIVGLGRGPLSLVSQLNASKFAYCLPYDTEVGSVLIGANLVDHMSLPENVALVTTPMFKNPERPPLYYFTLLGITLAAQRLPIPQSTFELLPNGTGGIFIDSGTLFTYLHVAAFDPLREALIDQLKLPVSTSDVPDELCFALPTSWNTSSATAGFPKLEFNFPGGNLTIQGDNYLGYKDYQNKALLCLLIRRTTQGASVLGNIQQQDMLVIYDLQDEMLSFGSMPCNNL